MPLRAREVSQIQNKILNRILENARNKQDEIALSFGEEKIRWDELEKETNQIARRILMKLKNKRQVPVAIYNSRNTKFIKYMIAVLKCGSYYIPLERNTPIERIRYIIDDAEAQLIITDAENEHPIHSLNNSIVTTRLGCYANESDESIEYKQYDDDLMYVLYTSGTTGYPKGVKIKYANLLNLVESFSRIVYNNFKKSISVGVLSSFSFDASVKQIFCSLHYGHTLCIADDTVKNFGRKIHNFHHENKLTVCDATPSHIELMTLQKVKKKTRIPYILIGGEVLKWETLHRFINFVEHTPSFINVYGPTECCVDVAFKEITQEELKTHTYGIVPIGIPLDNTTLRIKSENGDVIQDKYVEGDLFISGKQVGAGYINITSSSFFYESDVLTYKTGDRAYLNEYNEIVIVGRNDTQININGHRIELDEIKHAIENILSCPCFVFYETVGASKKIIACICSVQIYEHERSAFKHQLRNVIPKYMIPHHYIFVENVPVTTNGKFDKTALFKLLDE